MLGEGVGKPVAPPRDQPAPTTRPRKSSSRREGKRTHKNIRAKGRMQLMRRARNRHARHPPYRRTHVAADTFAAISRMEAVRALPDELHVAIIRLQQCLQVELPDWRNPITRRRL